MKRLASMMLFGGCLTLAAAAAAAPAPSVAGVYAMPGGNAAVTGSLRAAPGIGAGRQALDITMTPVGGSQPLRRYDVELSKRLHLIAISDDLLSFVHVHNVAPGADGHFRLALDVPRAGPWHLYADAVPSGLGQQVLRFDLDLGGPRATKPALQPTGNEGGDGRYGARIGALSLTSGQEAELPLTLLRDGQPAPDATPYLGVAAHAVLIDARDLSYVHVHAAPVEAADMPAMHGMEMAMPKLRAGAVLSPHLTLHVRPERSGLSVLWIQFVAGGAVRTLRFVVPVA